MRKWLDLLENDDTDYDHEADDRMLAMQELERKTIALIKNACEQINLEYLSDRRPISYDTDSGTAIIRVEGEVPLDKIVKLSHLGTGWKIYSNPNTGYGIWMEFTLGLKEFAPSLVEKISALTAGMDVDFDDDIDGDVDL